MLATIGDLVEDVVVRLDGPVNLASDSAASIARRQGGSAANVAVAAARLGFRSRFLGQVGDDPAGAALVAGMALDGVDIAFVRRRGTTGTIVVLVDHTGERSMLTDRGASIGFDEPSRAWLDDVDTLHVPLYSLSVAPLADTTTTLIGWCHERGIAVAIDLSSTAVIDSIGAPAVHDLVVAHAPAIVFANADEAAALDLSGPLGSAATIVKRGASPVIVHLPDGRAEVEVPPLDVVTDTTGAGDAFAAGFLTHPGWAGDVLGAVRAGNRAAAARLSERTI